LVAPLGPIGLQMLGLKGDGIWQCILAAFDVSILVIGYVTFVRGPLLSPPPTGSLRGRLCIVTGCNTGIGYETARSLAEAGAQVVFACRSEAKACAAMHRLVEGAAGRVAKEQLRFLPLDVSSFASVRRFVELFHEAKLVPHTLVLNAGVMLSSRSISTDGLEMTMASNHFGHFLLVQLLLPSLRTAEKQGEKPRIVVVGSNMCYMHDCFDFGEVVVAKSDAERSKYLERPYALFRAYGQSKLANLYFTTELARRLQAAGSNIPANAIHPGEVMTEVMRDMNPVLLKVHHIFNLVCYGFLKSARQGSFCTLHVATSPDLATARDGTSGAYFVRLAPAPLGRTGRNEAAAARLWSLSEEITGAKCPL